MFLNLNYLENQVQKLQFIKNAQNLYPTKMPPVGPQWPEEAQTIRKQEKHIDRAKDEINQLQHILEEINNRQQKYNKNTTDHNHDHHPPTNAIATSSSSNA